MSTNIKLSLALTKRSSVLDGIVMIEYVPVERIKALLKSNLLLLTWGEDYNWDFHKKLIMEQYANEKAMIGKYLQNYNKHLGGISVKYGKPKHKWGRSFPLKSLGLTCFRKVIRNSLIDGIYYDCDMKNAQPEILRNLCDSNTIPCPMIRKYCDDRENVLLEVQNQYGVNRDDAKQLFIRLCFFGTFAGWCIENKIANKSPSEFITLFERELKDIADTAKKFNPLLYETARKRKEDIGEVKEHKVLGSFFALYNQEYESRIVEAVMCYLINKTDLMKLPGTESITATYEFDGLKLLKSNVDMYDDGVDGVISLLNEKTFELTGFKLEWDLKPYEEKYDLNELIEQVTEDEKPNDDLLMDMSKIISALENSDCGVVETLILIKKNHYIFSVDKDNGSHGEWYGWNETRWEKSDAPLRKAIMYNVPEYWRSIMEKWNLMYGEKHFEAGEVPDCNFLLWKQTKKKMETRIFGLKSMNGINACVCVAKTLMANYTLEFDANGDLFGCENGVLDIAAECFRPYRFDDFITYSCGYDYTPSLVGLEVIDKDGNCRVVYESDLKEDFNISFKLIMDCYEQIFPDEELRKYVFKIMSTGLSGRAIEKFFVFNGAGRNGKGLTNEFLEKVFGSYFVCVSPTIFSENQNTKSSAGANPEIAKLNKMRYIVSKEPQKSAPLHNSVIKDLTGGGNTSARMLYSSKTDVKLCGTFIMECNDKPPFSEAPKDADAERINDIFFGSKFSGNNDEWDVTTGKTNQIFPVDAGLKEKLKSSISLRNAMLNILLKHLFLVKAKGYNVDFFKPESVKHRSLTYLQASYDLHGIFNTHFERHNPENKTKYLNSKGGFEDEDWTLSKVVKKIRESPEFFEISKIKRKEFSTNACEEFFKKNSFYKESVYMDSHTHAFRMKNWRSRPKEEDEDDSAGWRVGS